MRLMTEDSLERINKLVDFRKGIFDKIAGRNSHQIWLKASLKDVEKIVLILSSPRSGSSLLFTILRKSPQIYSLSGESTPFFKLNGLSSDFLHSDSIPDELIGLVDNDFDISRDFLSDFSIIDNQDDIIDNGDLLNQYIDDLILRFSIQWPTVDFSYPVFKKLAIQAFDVYWKTHKRFCKEEFYLELLVSLRNKYSNINPYYYDISEDRVKEKFPDIEVPSGPPNNVLMIEEPPFILLSPAKKVNKKDLCEKTLILKAPVNCYRMNYIEKIFPNADIRIIYLTRNPAASINGLYDGWLHRGFFSHNLGNLFRCNRIGLDRLKIAGYSDKYEWGKWWWNYDLPPGWQDYAEKRLEEICAFQWYSANKTITEYINYSKNKFCRAKYENIVRGVKSRTKEIRKIIDFLDIGHNIIEELHLDRLPVVQVTHPPQIYRWKKRKDMILPLLNDSKISKLCSELGYDKENTETWT